MVFAYGIAAGIAIYWLIGKTILHFVRRQFDPTRTKAVRKNLLDKMSYDTLAVFQTAVEQEIARRRPPS